jgi:hypothetical protein
MRWPVRRSAERRVRVGVVASSWREPLDAVWEFLHPHPGLRSDGHSAIDAWARESGCTLGTDLWEVDGDWTDDPAQLTTQLFYAFGPAR